MENIVVVAWTSVKKETSLVLQFYWVKVQSREAAASIQRCIRSARHPSTEMVAITGRSYSTDITEEGNSWLTGLLLQIKTEWPHQIAFYDPHDMVDSLVDSGKQNDTAIQY